MMMMTVEERGGAMKRWVDRSVGSAHPHVVNVLGAGFTTG